MLYSKLVLAKSYQMKLKEAYKDKLHDVTSKYTELLSPHNEVIEKYKKNFERETSVLTLEKEQLVNTLNDNGGSYESQIEAPSS